MEGKAREGHVVTGSARQDLSWGAGALCPHQDLTPRGPALSP